MMIALPDRYELIAPILGGGMSDTLHCRDKVLMRDVVIKALKPGTAAHRLLDELAALSTIRSRYVVEIYDVIRDGGGDVVAVIEEYLPGAALSPCAAGYDGSIALTALYSVAAGVAEIHAHGRIHRDLKPDNMKFDAEGQLNIFDFGLAKMAGAPGTTQLFYSQGYTAPEAFQPSPTGLHTFTPAVDVYAFGCVAVWILNDGVLPPELNLVPPSLPVPGFSFAGIAPVLPGVLPTLLDRCLYKAPATRPQMAEVRDAIAAELLRGKHLLLLTYGDTTQLIDSTNSSAKLSAAGAKIAIDYDGLAFVVSAVSGSVLINNVPASVGFVLKGSSVIVMGVKDVAFGLYPQSVTADVSHPEVTS
jgi:serine/threonine protein kinase